TLKRSGVPPFKKGCTAATARHAPGDDGAFLSRGGRWLVETVTPKSCNRSGSVQPRQSGGCPGTRRPNPAAICSLLQGEPPGREEPPSSAWRKSKSPAVRGFRRHRRGKQVT